MLTPLTKLKGKTNPQVSNLMISSIRNFHSWSIFFFFALIISCSDRTEPGVPSGINDQELSLQKVIFSLKANKKPEMMLAEKFNLEKYLQNKLQRKVEVILSSDSSVVMESFRNGTVDLAFSSHTDAVRNIEQNTGSILLSSSNQGNSHYQSVWLCLEEKTFQSIKDLRNRPVSFSSRSSTSGFLIPALDLAKKGFIGPSKSLTDFFSLVIYGNGYVSAVEKVLSGEVDAAAVSDYVFKGDNKFLTDTQKSKLKIFQEQGPVPNHVISARSSLSNNDKRILRQAFLDMNEENPELCDQIFNGKLIIVDNNEHIQFTLDALEVQKTLMP